MVGWDIGGANVKAALLCVEQGEIQSLQVSSLPFEIWRASDQLPRVLQASLAAVAHGQPLSAHAVTMTAELADVFATRRAGVQFVFQSFQSAFPEAPAYALSLAGQFEPLALAQTHPLDFAAANWVATAMWLARQFPDCLLVDVGSTTTDIIPILDGRLASSNRTDLERLSAGELVYTGLLRTNLAAIVQSLPVQGRLCRVASEYFAISADVHLILGHLSPADYSCPTPDGRPPTLATARARLARLVCADTEQLSPDEIDALAGYIYTRQLCQIEDGLSQVLTRYPRLGDAPVLALGSGAFLAAEAASRQGLKPHALPVIWEQSNSALAPGEVAPCVAGALLLAASLEGNPE
ncbi:MAG TPA: hydantoinase/oxoprolinase family protein [Anaerolineales bacterium]|nr:hydantoinase/oxoprolinase family protein [Anaerolineales bacterium]